MIPARRALCQPLRDDAFVRASGYALWCAPLVIALTLGVNLVAKGPRASVEAAPIVLAAETIEKPVLTQAVLRPRKNIQIQAALESTPSRDQLVALAFMPHADSIVNPALAKVEPAAARSELTTASTRPAPAVTAARAGSVENRAWRMQTLRAVGVAEGLRLISDGAMLTLAGVEPLDPSATCKRLDGVQEACNIRAASRLEVLTRGRIVTCRVYEAKAGETAVASCRADKIDLAEDLVKNGLARKAAV